VGKDNRHNGDDASNRTSHTGCPCPFRTEATCAHSSEPQIFPRELAHRGAAHQLHVALYFSSHQPERSLDAGLAGRS
jgi:hypothetical protein